MMNFIIKILIRYEIENIKNMTALSVNINKFALIRNSRDTNHPDLFKICEKILNLGVDGITIHPRPDERHTKFSDIEPIKNIVKKFKNAEFNIEGYPSESFHCNIFCL